ncbi:MAG TPA: phytanoyl-CoA dioxygenase family protein [Abditibacteriaceae bacterium]|nr:phytanoyl-CoA dioxygenase family protein [Abditibacteriaceae bacterium]
MNHLNSTMENAAAQYERDGFCLVEPIIPHDLVQRVISHMDAVVAGEYETGTAPLRMWNPGDDELKIRKIDQPHVSDRTIFEFITHPAIGRWAAALTGAQMVQLWAAQLLYKPPGGAAAGSIGWHQDRQYWTTWWEPESEVFTAWVAVSDVAIESGPMLFVPGSHRWGFLNQGDFFGSDHDLQREQIKVPPGERWQETPAVLPAGGVSFHHRFTYHGSGPNVSSQPRRSFALHLRTEKSRSVAGSQEYYVARLNDPEVSPILYEAV